MGGIFSSGYDPGAQQVPTALQVRNVDADPCNVVNSRTRAKLNNQLNLLFLIGLI
jgi:hypothetical protein